MNTLQERLHAKSIEHGLTFTIEADQKIFLFLYNNEKTTEIRTTAQILQNRTLDVFIQEFQTFVSHFEDREKVVRMYEDVAASLGCPMLVFRTNESLSNRKETGNRAIFRKGAYTLLDGREAETLHDMGILDGKAPCFVRELDGSQISLTLRRLRTLKKWGQSIEKQDARFAVEKGYKEVLHLLSFTFYGKPGELRFNTETGMVEDDRGLFSADPEQLDEEAGERLLHALNQEMRLRALLSPPTYHFDQWNTFRVDPFPNAMRDYLYKEGEWEELEKIFASRNVEKAVRETVGVYIYKLLHVFAVQTIGSDHLAYLGTDRTKAFATFKKETEFALTKFRESIEESW